MEHIGRYRLVRRVGSGAFATVWLAHDDELDVPVAIKLLADNWAHRADIRTRFLAEARILRQVEHANVVRVYDIGELPDGRPYFVMDYADQGSLADRLAKGRLAVDEAMEYAVQTARALSVLHDFGVVHRDVTPGNLLLRSAGSGGRVRLLLADLGMAKALAESSGITMTVGTPAFMAPEQASSTGGFDQRADVYALGAVTYMLLSGRPPYYNESPADLISRPPDLRPEPLTRNRPDVPPALEQVIDRALAYRAAERWNTAAEYATALHQALQNVPAGHEAFAPPRQGFGGYSDDTEYTSGFSSGASSLVPTDDDASSTSKAGSLIGWIVLIVIASGVFTGAFFAARALFENRF